jgi:hypothetical protein
MSEEQGHSEDQLRAQIDKLRTQILDLSVKCEKHASEALRLELAGLKHSGEYQLAVIHRDGLVRQIRELKSVLAERQSLLDHQTRPKAT